MFILWKKKFIINESKILDDNISNVSENSLENLKNKNFHLNEEKITDTKINSVDTAIEKFGYGRFVYLNIPSQILRIYDKGNEIFNSIVIVGSKDSPTPVMNSFITGVKLHPTWTSVPYGKIEKKFTKMLLSNERKYLEEAKVKWRKRPDGTYQFYQHAGDNNLLGKVRIEMISNKHIYLHDTNRPDLFNLEKRALSGGCIRVKKWKELSSLILNISNKDLENELKNKRTRVLPARPRIPIHITYSLEEIINGKKYHWDDLYA